MPHARLPLVPAGLTLIALLAPAPAAAQRDPFEVPVESRRVDVAGAAGYFFQTDWSDLVLLGSVSPFTGAFEQVLARDLVVDPGPIFDGTVTYWEGRYGFRAHAGFSASCLAVGRRCHDLARIGGSTSESVDVRAWQYDIGGAIGLVDHRPGVWVWPYVFVGVGGVTYDLEQSVGPPVGIFVERGPSRVADRQVVLARDGGDSLLIAIDELGMETELAVNFGVGTDFRLALGGAGIGLRLEVSDHVHRSPLDLRIAEIDALGSSGGMRLDFGLVHNLRASAGLVLQLGR